MKIIVSILFIGLLCFSSKSEVWTLDSCIDYAIANNIQIKMSEVNVESAELNVTQSKSGYLPNVSANASQAWNLGRGLTAENTYANRSTSSFNWGASANITVFDGLATPRRIAAAKANLSQIIERYEAAKEDITINVITGYLQALYYKELTDVAESQVKLSENEIIRREALVQAGKIPEIDLLEARSQLAADQLNYVQSQNNLTMAILDITRLLRLDSSIENFEIAPLSDSAILIMNPEEAYQLASRYSHNIGAARKGILASDANILAARSGYLPKLSFGTSIGSTYYRLSGMPNESFGSQMKNNYSTYFGFSLNVPIFDAFNTRNSIRQAKVEKINAELQLQQVEDELYRTINDAYYQAVGAYKKYDSSQIAEEFALKSFEAMREKYNLGRATPTEYEQANTKALQATAERVQAYYELILRTRILSFYASPH